MKQKIDEPESSEAEAGSTEYIGNHEIDKVLKKVKDDIKHYMAVAGQKEYKYKAQRVVWAAKELDGLNYPKSEICARLTKTLKGLVSERHVREALDKYPQYKNPTKMAEASAEDHGRGDIAATTEELEKKPVKEITLEDINKGNFSKSKLKQVAKHSLARALWWEQQAKQEQEKRSQQPEQIEIFREFYKKALESKMTNAELGKQIRKDAREYLKERDK
jgi:hypothetical protein